MRTSRLVAATVGLACIWLTACFSERGVYSVSLIESPDAPVLAGIARLVVVIDHPAIQREVVRDADGNFAISLDVAADERNGQLMLIGYDAADNVVAVGATPPVPWSAHDGELRIFLSAPAAFATLPEHLSVARSRLAVAPALGGVALAGGVDADGVVRAEVGIYSAFTHRLVALSPMPAARADAGILWDAFGRLQLFGGRVDAADAADMSSTWWLLGGSGAAYQTLPSQASWARAVPLVALGTRYAIAPGNESLLLDTETGQGALMVVPPLEGQVIATDSVGALCIGAGCGEDTPGGSGAVALTLQRAQSLVVEAANKADEPRFAALSEHRLAHHAGTTYVVGGTRQAEAAMEIWAAEQIATDTLHAEVLASLAVPRLTPAVAVVGPWLVVAGGYDPTTLAPLATAELIAVAPPHATQTVSLGTPRGNGALVVLGSGDALLVGGTTTDGAPLAALELFALPRYH